MAPLLQVFDMPNSLKFYCDGLGFEVVANELTPLPQGRDHPAQVLVEFDGRPRHSLGPLGRVLEIADDLEWGVGRVRPLHPNLNRQPAGPFDRGLFHVVRG